MSTIPDATVAISPAAGALAGGTGYCVVIAPVAQNADSVPRIYSSFKGILDQHTYAPGVDYAACHISDTLKQVIFVGIPIAVPGVVGRQDGSGVTGSCVISVAAGGSGAMEETDAIFTVTSAGTVGAPGIKGTLSLDGGTTEKTINLGTAASYAIPYVGLTLSFAAGSLNVGDVYSFSSTAPMWDQAGIDGARVALSAQQNLARSWMPIGDVVTHTQAGFVVSAVNTYKTAKKRFTGARLQVRDRLPLASMARVTVRMTGAPSLTFAEVGATGDTITRSVGSWINDGFAVGMYFSVTGSVSNNVSDKIAALSATVMTLGSTDLAAEVAAGCTVVASPAITFAEVGGTGDTITRSGGGSWLDDGFRAGDSLTIVGTASNNVVTDAVTSVTDTVITLNTTDLAAEVIGARSFTITKGETMAAWVSTMNAEFAGIDDEPKVNLGGGRLRHASPIAGWEFRRPVQWAASIRSYQHDVHHTTWAKEDGPLKGWSNADEHNNVVEYDEDTDGGLLAGRFTCARTWGNGPIGAFIAKDLTRGTDESTLSLQHNMDVANVFCTIVQSKTENITGKTLAIDPTTGFGDGARLQVVEDSVNTDVKQSLLREFVPGEGVRASLAAWTVSKTDDLRGGDATMTGRGQLVVNGTVVHVNTLIDVI